MRQNCSTSQNSQRAFTLIELLVTVSMVAILAAIAIPNLRDFIVGNRLSSNVNAFVGMLNYARSEAIVRNKQVVVCAKKNGASGCELSDDDWGKFETQVFVDEDGDDDWSAGDTTLKTFAALDVGRSQFAFSRESSSASVKVIKFQSGGFGTNTYRFNLNAVSTDTAYEIKYGRTVCISRPGRTRVLGLVNVCPPN